MTVVGVLPAQAARLRAALPGVRLRLFLCGESERVTCQPGETVVVWTRFVRHAAQERAHNQGGRVVYHRGGFGGLIGAIKREASR